VAFIPEPNILLIVVAPVASATGRREQPGAPEPDLSGRQCDENSLEQARSTLGLSAVAIKANVGQSTNCKTEVLQMLGLVVVASLISQAMCC
jgi:hypothetical protein